MDINQIDVKENYINSLDRNLLAILLKDRSSGRNIIWATDNYAHKGIGFQKHDHIEIPAITGYNSNVVKPRIAKSKTEQFERIRQKGEVFTPSWICNIQNNAADNAWFGTENVFNTEHNRGWITTGAKIPFPTFTGKTWEDYVLDTRLEIACGEAPYLVSRYDAVTGKHIELHHRIGLLDRKMRVIMENTNTEETWHKWTKIAFQNVYGYDWQGDNVLLARENLLLSYCDYYKERFEQEPKIEELQEIAKILSWNIWQMDGLKFVIPDSCQKTGGNQLGLFDTNPDKTSCEGCVKNDPWLHTGIYCKIKDWKANKTIKFLSLLKNGVQK